MLLLHRTTCIGRVQNYYDCNQGENINMPSVILTSQRHAIIYISKPEPQVRAVIIEDLFSLFEILVQMRRRSVAIREI